MASPSPSGLGVQVVSPMLKSQVWVMQQGPSESQALPCCPSIQPLELSERLPLAWIVPDNSHAALMQIVTQIIAFGFDDQLRATS